jgi:[histone H3]-lysine36 N-dimethyltransferase SETMAR
MEKNEVRAVIKYLQKKGMTPKEIYEDMHGVLGDDGPSYQVVKNWSRDFKFGRNSCEHAPGAGPPKIVITPENINLVHDMVLKDRRITVRFIAETCGFSVGSVEKILHHELGLKKVAARWVPKMLSADQKRIRQLTSEANLALINKNPDEFAQRFVTVDETWVHHYDPESKRQSMEWRHQGSPPPKKFRVIPSAGKILSTVFWDFEGVLFVDYLPKGKTINGQYYANLIPQLREAIKEKRRGKLRRGVLFHQDNAPSHKSGVAMAAIHDAGFEILEHPPYSPDLAPSDFFLFPKLKEQLRGTRFLNDEEVIEVVNDWLGEQGKQFYFQCFQALQHRYEKCIRLSGDYVEK